MKDALILGIVFTILMFSVYNAVSDKFETHEHHVFFKKMNQFANAGGRFTAEDGEELCTEINKMKFHNSDLDLIDCEKFNE